jgi:hypothetical protein
LKVDIGSTEGVGRGQFGLQVRRFFRRNGGQLYLGAQRLAQ